MEVGVPSPQVIELATKASMEKREPADKEKAVKDKPTTAKVLKQVTR